MASVNKAFIIGNLGKDPVVRRTQDGKAVASFSVATTDKWKDKQTGEQREKTEWHNIVAFGRLAEICGEYLSKGKQVYIEGRLRTRSWEKDGVTRYVTEIEATTLQMLGGGQGGDGHNQTGYRNNGGNDGNRNGVSGQQGTPTADDDDVPF